MPKFNIFIARYPFKRVEDPDVTNYYAELLARLRNGDELSQQIGQVECRVYDDTPITMTRNRSVEDAKAAKADYMIMIDSDIKPELMLGIDPMAQRFFDSSFDFAIKHEGPCIVAAPYCGPPPHENIYAFKVGNRQSDHPNKAADWSIEQFTREEAAQRSGIEQCMALATGLMLIDMRVFKLLKPPYFDYTYSDEFKQEKITTEDCYFTRNVVVSGNKIYCNWYSWVGHWKYKCVSKPVVMTPDQVHNIYKEAFTEPRLDSDCTLLHFKSKAG